MFRFINDYVKLLWFMGLDFLKDPEFIFPQSLYYEYDFDYIDDLTEVEIYFLIFETLNKFDNIKEYNKKRNVYIDNILLLPFKIIDYQLNFIDLNKKLNLGYIILNLYEELLSSKKNKIKITDPVIIYKNYTTSELLAIKNIERIIKNYPKYKQQDILILEKVLKKHYYLMVYHLKTMLDYILDILIIDNFEFGDEFPYELLLNEQYYQNIIPDYLNQFDLDYEQRYIFYQGIYYYNFIESTKLYFYDYIVKSRAARIIQKNLHNWLWKPITNDNKLGINPRLSIKYFNLN